MRRRRKIKKIWILILGALILLGGILVLLKNHINQNLEQNESSQNNTKEIREKLEKLGFINEQIDYFKMDYLDRYISYKENMKTLSNEDIVTKVNIGLDMPYYTNTVESPYKNQVYILSNKYTSLGKYVPNDLQVIKSSCSNGTRKLVGVAKEAFEEMCDAAKQQGYTIRAMSTYRSYEYQVGLYQKYVDSDGVEKADTYSARPGFSEHQTGLVADIDNGKIAYTNFDKAKEYEWMKNNSYRYGWIERYPKGKEDTTGYTYESWHYRYVGKEIATYIHEHNITFDEYYVKFIENKK